MRRATWLCVQCGHRTETLLACVYCGSKAGYTTTDLRFHATLERYEKMMEKTTPKRRGTARERRERRAAQHTTERACPHQGMVYRLRKEMAEVLEVMNDLVARTVDLEATQYPPVDIRDAFGRLDARVRGLEAAQERRKGRVDIMAGSPRENENLVSAVADLAPHPGDAKPTPTETAALKAMGPGVVAQICLYTGADCDWDAAPPCTGCHTHEGRDGHGRLVVAGI